MRPNAPALLRAPYKREDAAYNVISTEDGSLRGLPVGSSETLGGASEREELTRLEAKTLKGVNEAVQRCRLHTETYTCLSWRARPDRALVENVNLKQHVPGPIDAARPKSHPAIGNLGTA